MEALKERFKIDRKVGEGTYGEVYFGYDFLRDHKVAIKKVKFHGRESQGIPPTTLREIAILKELEHKSIVGLEDVIMFTEGGDEGEQGKANDQPTREISIPMASEKAEGRIGLFLVFPMMDGDLKTLIQVSGEECIDKLLTKEICETSPLVQSLSENSSPPSLCKIFIKQVIEATDYLHSNKIFHRDLKPANILVDQANLRVKVCDFGLARTIHQPLRAYTSEVMSLWYRPPELCASNKNYSIGIDNWAIGCILAEMLTGRPLFKAKTQIELLFNIMQTLPYSQEDVEAMPEEVQKVLNKVKPKKERSIRALLFGADPLAIDLAERFLVLNPLKRLTCKEALLHPYFKA